VPKYGARIWIIARESIRFRSMVDADFYEEHGRRDSYCKVRPLEAYVLAHHNNSSPTTCQSSYSPPQEAAAPPPPSNASNTSSPSPEAAFVGLDEFRSRIMQGKIENDTTGRSAGGGAVHRLEPSGVQGRQGARAQQGGQGRRQHPWWRQVPAQTVLCRRQVRRRRALGGDARGHRRAGQPGALLLHL
jgi:hypothetical protein